MKRLVSITDWHDVAPWRTRKVSFLVLDIAAPPMQAFDLADKRAAVAHVAKRPGERELIVQWTGAHFTEARRARFTEDHDDLSRVAEHVA